MIVSLYIAGAIVLLTWLISACLPFVLMYKIFKDLDKLHKEVEEEDKEGN